MQADYDAIVIGAGLGGLTAGALFAHAGHRVLIIEQNETFGGAASCCQSSKMAGNRSALMPHLENSGFSLIRQESQAMRLRHSRHPTW